MLYWIVRFVCWVLLRVLYALCGGLQVEGQENVPRRGGILITPNHISDADPPTLAFALPRPCCFMAKEELFHIPLLGPFMRLMRAFPVKRWSADRAALRKAEELLESGEAVVIFPEGQVSETARLQPLLPGALLAAQRANVPILPTVILGTNYLMPYGRLMPRPAGRRMIVRFGKPVTVAELTNGERGGEGLKAGAERLGEILRDLGAPHA